MNRRSCSIGAFSLLAALAISGCGDARKGSGEYAEGQLTPDEAAEAAPAAQPDTIPRAVANALDTRFPGAAIDRWYREEENGEFIYDCEFRQDGRKREADVMADGTILNWEEAVSAADVPDDVLDVAKSRYPGAMISAIMRVTEVRDGEDVLRGFEVGLETADGKFAEMTIAPDGTPLEEGAGEEPGGEETPE